MKSCKTKWPRKPFYFYCGDTNVLRDTSYMQKFLLHNCAQKGINSMQNHFLQRVLRTKGTEFSAKPL